MKHFKHTLATQLAILVSDHQKGWDKYLPLVLLSYHTAVQERMHGMPALLMFGHDLHTHVDLTFGAPPESEIVARLYLPPSKSAEDGAQAGERNPA